MDFIYCVWAFNKNYERKLDIVADDEESQESTLESDEDDDSDDKPIK